VPRVRDRATHEHFRARHTFIADLQSSKLKSKGRTKISFEGSTFTRLYLWATSGNPFTSEAALWSSTRARIAT
jgi:hypothetical protein